MIKEIFSLRIILLSLTLALLFHSCSSSFEKHKIDSAEFKKLKSISELTFDEGVYYLNDKPYNGLVKGAMLENLSNLFASFNSGKNIQELSLLEEGKVTDVKRYISHNFNDVYNLEKHIFFQQKEGFEVKTIYHYHKEHLDSMEVIQSKKTDPSLILNRALKVYYPQPFQQVKKVFQFEKGALILEETYSLNNVLIERKVNKKVEDIVLNGEVKLLEKTENNGNVINVLEYTSGKMVGVAKKYKDDVLIEERAILDGAFKKYYNDGTLAFETNIVKGKKQGDAKEYYSNGALWKTYQFKNDLKHGEYKAYYTNNVLGKEGEYHAGKLIGQYKEYYDSGNKWKTTTYDNTGRWLSYISWYTNGQTAEDRRQTEAPEIVSYTKYYENGQIRIKTSYKRNEIHGRYKNWEKNGNLYRDTYYVLGKEVGDREAFERKDSLIWNYRFATTDSIVGTDTFKIKTSYFKNGNLSERYRTLNNHKTGKYERFYRNGKLDYCYYQTPQYKHGKYTAYHPDGSIRNEFYMFKGEKVQTKNMFEDLSKMEADTIEYSVPKIELNKAFICTKEKCASWLLPEVEFKLSYPSSANISIAKEGVENDNYVSITSGTKKDLEEFTIGWMSGNVNSFGNRILSSVEQAIKNNYQVTSSYVGKGNFNGRNVHKMLIEYQIKEGAWDEVGNWKMLVILVPLQNENGIVIFMQAKDTHPTIKTFNDFGKKGVTGAIWKSFTPEI